MTADGPLDAETAAALAAAAESARERAHAPYSRFRVGAAVLDEHGRIHAGCNVENAAYPLGHCAEGNALAAMVLAGGTRLHAAAVCGPPGQVTAPCGGCRQRLWEFGAPDTPVLLCANGEVLESHALGDLLPGAFGPGSLRGAPSAD